MAKLSMLEETGRERVVDNVDEGASNEARISDLREQQVLRAEAHADECLREDARDLV